MINADMREYGYYLYGDPNAYGQSTLSDELQGTVKLSINTTTQTVQDNIRYKDCTYIGLTHNKDITDKYVIQYGDEKLKVLYVNPKGRFIQVFLKNL